MTDEGRSEFWEALGRRFTGLPYQEADLLSQSHKEFIESLFPQDDIYLALLDSKARLVLGRVGEATKPAQHLLENIGFHYLDEVDENTLTDDMLKGLMNGLGDNYAAYYTAVKINDDPVQFEYGMRTNIGNALVYGDLETVDPVTMSGLLNDYMYVEKVYEKYTMHTRTVTHTDGKGHTYTTVQTYYTWDYHAHDVI